MEPVYGGIAMNKHDADLIAAKLTNDVLADWPFKQVWFDLTPEERTQIEEHIAHKIHKAVSELER